MAAAIALCLLLLPVSDGASAMFAPPRDELFGVVAPSGSRLLQRKEQSCERVRVERSTATASSRVLSIGVFIACVIARVESLNVLEWTRSVGSPTETVALLLWRDKAAVNLHPAKTLSSPAQEPSICVRVRDGGDRHEVDGWSSAGGYWLSTGYAESGQADEDHPELCSTEGARRVWFEADSGAPAGGLEEVPTGCVLLIMTLCPLIIVLLDAGA